jgi:hypothetical protein
MGKAKKTGDLYRGVTGVHWLAARYAPLSDEGLVEDIRENGLKCPRSIGPMMVRADIGGVRGRVRCADGRPPRVSEIESR